MYGVIDIGSNSVRLMISDGKSSIKKYLCSTKLADGLAVSGELNSSAIKRTVDAVGQFCDVATKEYGAEIYIFATEATRSASNAKIFTDEVYAKTGITVDILDGMREAEIGFLGAYDHGVACVVDIGGASTEIIVGDNKDIRYAKSLKIGAVRLRDMCGERIDEVDAYLEEMLKGYGTVPKADEVIGIGGTASTIVAIILGQKVYDAKRVHNYQLTRDEIIAVNNRLSSMTLIERKEVDGLGEGRADIIVGASYELIKIMDMLGVSQVRVSESDNLEGYLKKKILKGI